MKNLDLPGHDPNLPDIFILENTAQHPLIPSSLYPILGSVYLYYYNPSVAAVVKIHDYVEKELKLPLGPNREVHQYGKSHQLFAEFRLLYS